MKTDGCSDTKLLKQAEAEWIGMPKINASYTKVATRKNKVLVVLSSLSVRVI